MFKSIRKIYKKEETRYWIFTIKTTIYKIFILLLKYPPIYIKEGVILERCQKPFCLEYYFEKIKE